MFLPEFVLFFVFLIKTHFLFLELSILEFNSFLDTARKPCCPLPGFGWPFLPSEVYSSGAQFSWCFNLLKGVGRKRNPFCYNSYSLKIPLIQKMLFSH